MTSVLPAPVAEIKSRIDELSRSDRLVLNEVLRVENEKEPAEDRDWPWELLEKRDAALKSRESTALPLEEVAKRLRARRVARS
jgi:hypothetical protein